MPFLNWKKDTSFFEAPTTPIRINLKTHKTLSSALMCSVSAPKTEKRFPSTLNRYFGPKNKCKVERVHTRTWPLFLTSAFTKRSVFASTLMRFQIYPLWRAFSKRFAFGVRKHRFSVDRRPNRILKKLRLQIYPDSVWTGPESVWSLAFINLRQWALCKLRARSFRTIPGQDYSK